MSTGGVYPVIMCGGSGTRLWPVSRKSYPKQFSALFPGGSLFQRTLTRLAAALIRGLGGVREVAPRHDSLPRDAVVPMSPS